MSPRQLLGSLAAILIVAGLVLGFKTVSTDGVSCGSAFSPSSAEARQADNNEEIVGTLAGATPDTDADNNATACDSAVGDAKPLAYGGLALGAVALIASLVVSSERSTRTT